VHHALHRRQGGIYERMDEWKWRWDVTSFRDHFMLVSITWINYALHSQRFDFFYFLPYIMLRNVYRVLFFWVPSGLNFRMGVVP
jgi:hypothetical protein